MCGIFGVIDNSKISATELQCVSSIISHRGPDDEGFLLINTENKEILQTQGKDSRNGLLFPDILSVSMNYNAAFIHRRLSILDLSTTGHQPLSYQDESLWITFNGEIYNYIEIKERLKIKGYIFYTSTDTEVILASYKEWGNECVNYFNGIWAFAIYDKNKNIFFISRDRVGVKPLYYYNTSNLFILSSEIKAIRNYLKNKLSLNFDKIEEYLNYGQIFVGKDENTFFEDIKQLSPGHNLIYNEKSYKIIKYWEIIINENNFNLNENINKFRELFEQSIRLQFRSDVEVGSCLSGGIDSSSIVSFASTLFKNNIHTFSAIWPGEIIDESYYINIINKKYLCNAHPFEPDLSNIMNIIDKEIWHLEIPISGASLIAQWSVFEHVKKHGIKVVLDGEGSDEILAGYPKYIITYLNELIFNFNWIEIFKQYPSLKSNGYSLKKIINLQKAKFLLNNSEIQYKDFPLQYNSLSSFLVQDIIKYGLPTLLHQKDRNSMAHSIEARVPYLDHNLIQFALSIPSKYKIQGASTKVVLKEAMKAVLPKEIYQRKDKIGFATPIEKKLFNQDSENNRYITDFINKSVINDYIKNNKKDIDITFNYRRNFCLYSLARFIDIWS